MAPQDTLDVLVTGAGGQLGRALIESAAALGHTVGGLRHSDLAVEDADAVREVIERHRPKAVVHAAAWTDVDGCERDPDRADRINGHGTAAVAASCRAVGARLAYVSTDFVFDGRANRPYPVDATPAPLSAYGSSKLLGERAVLEEATPGMSVVRTSWVFGPGGKNFPSAILARARSGQPLRVVDDQFGSPTYTVDLAEALIDLVTHDDASAASGIFHASNEGHCHWRDFAIALVEAAGLGDASTVAPMSSGELDRPAERPAYSVLDSSRLASLRGQGLPHYSDAIRRYLLAESGGAA